jgi:hypothetical protein
MHEKENNQSKANMLNDEEKKESSDDERNKHSAVIYERPFFEKPTVEDSPSHKDKE